MFKALKFVLFWLGAWVGYGLLYGAIYAYECVKSHQESTGWNRPFWDRAHGPFGLPHLWELGVVFVLCGAGAFFTALRFIRSEPARKRGTAP